MGIVVEVHEDNSKVLETLVAGSAINVLNNTSEPYSIVGTPQSAINLTFTTGAQGPKGDDKVFVSSTAPVNPTYKDIWVKFP